MAPSAQLVTQSPPFPSGVPAAFTAVVIAVGVKQENALVKELRETAPELRLHVIGDCYDPRTALEAIHEGFKIATEA